MTTKHEATFEHARAVSRRAYERRRLELAVVHAATFSALSALLSFLVIGARGLVWLPMTFLVWSFVEFRGVEFLRGARVGALAGVVTLALPLSVLRWCCRPGALGMIGADCCSLPGACAGAGAVVGLVLTCFLPTPGKRVYTVLGMMLGIAALAPMKCATLLLGEGLGLVGGLLAGVLATSAARTVVRARARDGA